MYSVGMPSYQYHPTSPACTIPQDVRMVVVSMIVKKEQTRSVLGMLYTVYQPRHDGWRLVIIDLPLR